MPITEFDRASQAPSGGAAEWGAITGTLGDQTDLDTALGLKFPSASILRSYLAADVTYNNVDVLANTALSVTVAASGIYEIELNLYCTTAAVTGFTLDFAVTGTHTNFTGFYAEQAEGSSANLGTLLTSAGTDYNSTAFNGSGLITFNGSVEINGAGTFLLRGSQDSAVVENTTILRGSTLILTKMN